MKYSVTENFQNKIIAKIDKINKLFPEDSEVNVALMDIKLDKKVEVTVKLPNKRIIKAEVTKNDLMAAVDEAVDILERQMIKYKSKLNSRAKRNKSFADELKAISSPDDVYHEESNAEIIKVKTIDIKPMDPEEATMEMELLGHSFFVFKDANTNNVLVVYKRKHGGYGMIEPEI